MAVKKATKTKTRKIKDRDLDLIAAMWEQQSDPFGPDAIKRNDDYRRRNRRVRRSMKRGC
jgi:hypothetical protein